MLQRHLGSKVVWHIELQSVHGSIAFISAWELVITRWQTIEHRLPHQIGLQIASVWLICLCSGLMDADVTERGYDDFFSKRQTVKRYITLKCTNRPCFTYDSEIAVVNSPFLWHHIFSISLALLGSSIVLAWVCFYWDYIKASALVFFCHHKWPYLDKSWSARLQT